MDIDERKEGYWKAEAHFTGANYHAKKLVFLLFINRKQTCQGFLWSDSSNYFTDRLVESVRIKRAIENVYSNILPKGSVPFIYLRQAVQCSTQPKQKTYILPAF